MNYTKALIVAAALALPVAIALAQDGGQPQPPRGPRPPQREGGPQGGDFRPQPSPIMAALDANHDGVIDATEIANAAVALRALDKNSDGQLTADEIRPQRPGGRPGQDDPAARRERRGQGDAPPADGQPRPRRPRPPGE